MPVLVCATIYLFQTEDILTISKRQEATDSNAFNNSQRSAQAHLEDSLIHLRLDHAPPQSIQCSILASSNTGEQPSRSGARGFLVGGGHSSRGSRANSPGRSGGGSDGRGVAASTGKVMRRKRTGRSALFTY